MRICEYMQREKERERERGSYYYYIHQLLLGTTNTITIISYYLYYYSIMLFQLYIRVKLLYDRRLGVGIILRHNDTVLLRRRNGICLMCCEPIMSRRVVLSDKFGYGYNIC